MIVETWLDVAEVATVGGAGALVKKSGT